MDLSKLPASDDISRFLSTPDKPYVDPFSKVKGHVIATRITAENAADGWKPTVGKIEELSFQSLPSVWGYFSVRTPAEACAAVLAHTLPRPAAADGASPHPAGRAGAGPPVRRLSEPSLHLL